MSFTLQHDLRSLHISRRDDWRDHRGLRPGSRTSRLASRGTEPLSTLATERPLCRRVPPRDRRVRHRACGPRRCFGCPSRLTAPALRQAVTSFVCRTPALTASHWPLAVCVTLVREKRVAAVMNARISHVHPTYIARILHLHRMYIALTSRISPVYLSHVYRMHVPRMPHACHTHVSRMSHACPTHVPRMSHACPTHVARMSHACPTHVARMCMHLRAFMKESREHLPSTRGRGGRSGKYGRD